MAKWPEYKGNNTLYSVYALRILYTRSQERRGGMMMDVFTTDGLGWLAVFG